MHLVPALQALLSSSPATGLALTPGFRAFSQAAAPLVVTALWQGAAVALALTICFRVAPRISAAHRFAIWFSGFIALVSLPLFPLLAGLFAAAPLGVSTGLAEAPVRPWLQLDIRWSLAIAAIWVAASILRAVDLAIHSFRLRKLWKTALPVDLADSSVAALPHIHQLPGRAPVHICTTQQLDRPSVIGFFAPRILIPEWLYSRLTPGELKQIVLHETEHLRRGDDWTNLFQKLCLVLFPLNPALWWMERRLCAEREMACDDGVIRITHAPRAYAACLTSLAERGLSRRAEALSLGAWQRRPELVNRVHSILGRGHALSPLATRALFGALSCGLVFGSVELARCPQLIAFVPSQPPQVTQALVHSDPPRLISTAYVPARKPRTVRASSGFRARNTKAILPTGRPSVPTEASLQRSLTGARELNISSAQFASNSPKAEMLKAVLPDPRANQPHVQQWIVLATWEQVETSRRAVPLSSDYDSDQRTDQNTSNSVQDTSNSADRPNARPNAPAAIQNSGQPTTQITITRLIFRVIALNSNLNQPAPLPIRAGWLVFQL